MEAERVDDVFLALGKWGRWQIQQAIWLSLTYIPLAFQYTSIVFIGYEPGFKCSSNETYFSFTNSTNISPESSNIFNITPSDGHAVETCRRRGEHTGMPCGGQFEFVEPRYISIVSEWDLVCDSAPLVQTSQTFLSLGLMLGFFTLPLSDRYGRKKVLVISHWIMMLAVGSLALSPNIIFFIANKFLIGFLFPSVNIVMCVMLLELFPVDQRGPITLLSKFVWAGGIMALSFVAYLFRTTSWRYFQLCLSGFSLLVIMHTFVTEESVRWLLAVGRKKDAIAILKRAAKFNKIPFKKNIAPLLEGVDFGSVTVFSSLQDLALVDLGTSRSRISLSVASVAGSTDLKCPGQSKPLTNGVAEKDHSKKWEPSGDVEKQKLSSDLVPNEASKSPHVLDIFRHPILRKYLFISSYILFVDIMMYYGLLLMSSSLAGDRFINVLLSGTVELPAYIICIYVLHRFGRKPVMLGFHIWSGGMLVSTIIVSVCKGPDLLVTAFATLGKFGSCGTLIVTFLHSSEIIPTNLRGLGVGFTGSVASIGGLLAPFSSYLVQFGVWIPGAVFSACCVTVCGLIYFLPETRGRKLPQTISDLETWNDNDDKETSAGHRIIGSNNMSIATK